MDGKCKHANWIYIYPRSTVYTVIYSYLCSYIYLSVDSYVSCTLYSYICHSVYTVHSFNTVSYFIPIFSTNGRIFAASLFFTSMIVIFHFHRILCNINSADVYFLFIHIFYWCRFCYCKAANFLSVGAIKAYLIARTSWMFIYLAYLDAFITLYYILTLS